MSAWRMTRSERTYKGMRATVEQQAHGKFSAHVEVMQTGQVIFETGPREEYCLDKRFDAEVACENAMRRAS